jgi:hypothetical protein
MFAIVFAPLAWHSPVMGLILTRAWRGRNRLLAVAAEGWLLARDPDGGFRCIFGRMPDNSRRLAVLSA